MHIIIFGATGCIGLELMRKALEKHHTITVVSKNPESLSVTETHVHVVQGSLEDSSSLDKALEGQDAVISTICDEQSVQNILYSMQKKGVKRFIGVLPQENSAQHGFFPGLFSRFFYSRTISKLQQNFSKEGIDWTIVQPPKMTFEPPKGAYQLYFDRCPLGDRKISVMDVADFMISQISKSECTGKIVSLGY